ncbi:MAG TPA: FAD-binding oxidoreductase [Acidimicrobiales bacterium]|nr:FAD-binding oxidoreductase [Acidimicrobiales bacterium]
MTTTTNRPPLLAVRSSYDEAVGRLTDEYRSLPPDAPVRLAKRTSNLFRPRAASSRPGLDVSAFESVIEVDRAARTADVGGMTTYEDLVATTLPYGLMPKVVPELRTITLGGAITGLGIESSSWRSGMPHESMLELDILTGAGEVVTATPDGDHADLFYGFPNSYGTLGYALRVRIELEPVAPWVHLRHLRFDRFDALLAALSAVCDAGEHAGEQVAFVDGVVFAPGECYLTLGSWCDDPGPVSDYGGQQIYYRSIQHKREDWLRTESYLWRWDTDWFWCSRAFKVQVPWVRRLLPRRWLRSDSYWRIVDLDRRYGLKRRLDRWQGRPSAESVVQDVELPVERAAEFLHSLQREVPIAPIWLCPLRQRPGSARWPLYPLTPGQLYINFGFWSTCPLLPGMDPAHHNRWVEAEVERLGGRKSLYSTSFYDEDTFWSMYNGPAYGKLKERYDPDRRLLDLYAKCVRSQ